MLRRRFTEDPTSRLAIWARRFALFSLVATLLSIIIVRSGLLEIVPAVATFAGALAFAGVAILLALAALIVIWIQGLGGASHALTAMLIGLALVAYPSYLGLKAYRLPAISDISTDPIDPPRFDAIARLRPRDANPVVYAGLYAAEQQRAAYPDIEPLVLSATPKETFDAALAVVTKRKWRVVDSRDPQQGRREGRIEAIARTPIMGFRDDVVIRIRSAPDGAQVDARSSSRYGRYDFGTNAARIRSLLDDIDESVGTEQEKQERIEQRQKRLQQKAAQQAKQKPQPKR